MLAECLGEHSALAVPDILKEIKQVRPSGPRSLKKLQWMQQLREVEGKKT